MTDTSNCKRFWVSQALTPPVIKKGLQDAKSWTEYEGLAEKGFARQHADWLVGMNFSPYATLISGNTETFPVGRVQTAILAAVAQRNMEIQNFTPEAYYECIATLIDDDGNKIKTLLINPQNQRTTFTENSEYIKKACEHAANDKKIQCKGESVRKTLNPPHLLGLTELQQLASRLYNYSPALTLSAAQKLYEDYKCLSYPRTPSTVMGDDDAELFREKFELLKGNCTMKDLCNVSKITSANKDIFNSKKLESHHALIPLDFLPDKATEPEKNVYNLVSKYFFMTLMPQCIFDEKTIYVKNGEFSYKGKIKKIIDTGWKKYDGTETNDGNEQLTNFNELNCQLEGVVPEKKYTQPKKQFTETSLLAFMKNPTNCNDDDKKLAGLGTPATRASIIEKLQDDGYLIKKNKNMLATEKGFFLLKTLYKSPETSRICQINQTTKWEERLEASPVQFENEIKKYVKYAVSRQLSVEKYRKNIIGNCPFCKRELRENKNGFYCPGYKSNPACKFTVWKKISGASITQDDVQKILNDEPTKLKKMKSRDGKEFSARLILDKEKQGVKFLFEKKDKK